MAANASLTVKIVQGTEIRRFSTFNKDLTWESLAKTATKLFELPDAKNLKLTYVDDEGDKITLSSDAELKEAKGLALQTSPAVLRLTIVNTTDAKTNDAKTKSSNPTKTDAATDGQPHPLGAPDEMAALFQNLAKSLPGLVGQLPEPVRRLLPHAELDIAATLAANAAANAPCAAAAAAACAEAHGAAAASASAAAASAKAANPNGVHPGVTCDRSGQCPIVGNRYHLVGHNYDLCEAEYEKLGDKEKALYQCIKPPAAKADEAGAEATGIHPGVECDRSGMAPIVGMRYNLKGHNYDLCQAEYDKLPQQEKLLYAAIPPPVTLAHAHGPCGPWRPSGRWHGHRGNHAHGNNNNANGENAANNNNTWGANVAKLAARFVRDVTIFDGTQMAPSTPFTKIWRLKNTGEVAWPPGTKMLFVGGDQMTTEMMVPLSRGSPVQPGEEVDVAVEMVAPAELGRYLGYWRLVGPQGRRKFGQRVWCHVQVVDPAAGPPAMNEADLDKALAEIQKKKSDLAEAEADAGDVTADEPTADKAAAAAGPSGAAPAPAAEPADVSDPPAADAPLVPAALVADDAAERASDDGVLVSEADAEPLDNDKTTAPAASAKAAGKAPVGAEAAPPLTAAEKVTQELEAMGFTDGALVAIVLDKHGADLNACARDLAQATEWEAQLDDLAEMGFTNRELNKTLMLKHSGNVKRTVRELVEDTA